MSRPNLSLLSPDTLFAFPFFGIYIALYRDPKGVILAALLILYVLIDVLWPWSKLDDSPTVQRRILLAKLTLVLLAIGTVVVLPTILLMAVRLSTGSTEVISDSMAQIEVGLDFLRQGLNPYAQDYSQTLMAQVPYLMSGVTQNPALYSLPYPPLIFEVSYPVYLLWSVIFGWWDQRIIFMLALVVSLFVISLVTNDPARKLILTMLLGLNPMLMVGFLVGMNDIFAVVWLALTVVLFYRGRVGLAGAMLALALAAKQTVWFIAPFFLAWILVEQGVIEWPLRVERIKSTLKLLMPAGIVLAITLLPFFFWGPSDFIEGILGSPLGASTQPAVIEGVGLGRLLLDLGIIPNAVAQYPFAAWQALLGLPVLVLLLGHQYKNGDPRLIWIHGACFGMVIGFFSREFFDRFVGFYLVVAALGALADPVADPLKRVNQNVVAS